MFVELNLENGRRSLTSLCKEKVKTTQQRHSRFEMLSSTLAGFHNALFSKGIIISFSISSILCQVFKSQPRYDLQLFPKIIPGNQFYRLITSNFNFSTSSELLLGVLLLYNFRVLERQWGTKKFASFLILASMLSSLLNVLLLSFSRKYLTRLASGPIGIVSSLYILYSIEIPTSYTIKFVGIKVSDHVFLLLILLQFSLLSGINSIFPTLTGMIAGIIVYNFKPLAEWRIPNFICNITESYILPLLKSNKVRKVQSTNTYPLDSRQDSVYEGQSSTGDASASEEDIVLLESMGFQRERIVEALRVSSNDVNRAIAFLLS